MAQPLSALARLQARHKQAADLKPKSDSLVEATKKSIAAVKATVQSTTTQGKKLGLADMLNKTRTINSTTDRVADAVTKREEAGLYTCPSKLNEVEGLNGDEVIDQLRELDYALIAKTPSIGLLSIKIRKNLEQYPELTHILSDDQLGIICSGVLVHANVNTEPKTKAAQGAAQQRKINDLSASIGADDI